MTIRAFGWTCGCAVGKRGPGWRVENGEEPEVPWIGGGPAQGVAVQDGDMPVPAVRVSGGPAGHRPDCTRTEIQGLEVVAARWVERERRLVLEEERSLGRTPVREAVLPQGSWLCTVRGPAGDVRVPVLSPRGGHAEAEATILAPGEAPVGFALVSRGAFRFGDRNSFGPADVIMETADFCIARFPVTCGEYLEFLNGLLDEGRAQEAARRAPRDADRTH